MLSLRDKLSLAQLRAFLLCITALGVSLGGSLASQGRKIKPLAEIARITGIEDVLVQRHHLQLKGKDMLVAWTEQCVQKGQLDGQVVYLVKSRGELAEIAEGRFRLLQETALYDEQLRLIAMQSLGEAKGRPVVDRFRWQDGKLLHWLGRKKKPKEIPTEVRPAWSEGILMTKKRIAAGEKKTFHFLDSQKRKVQRIEIERIKGEWKLGDFDAIKYHSSQEGGITFYVEKKSGKVLQGEFEKVSMVMLITEMSPESCSNILIGNSLVQAQAINLHRNAWRKSGSRWRHKAIGLEVGLPKADWNRREELEGNLILQTTSTDGNAAFSINLQATTPLVSVEAYAGLVCDSLKDAMFPKGQFTNKPIKVAKHAGRRIEFEQKVGEQILLTTMDAVIVRGYAIRFIQVRKAHDETWVKDLDKILKSLRIKR